MVKSCLILFFLLIVGSTISAYGQIQIVDEIEEEIYRSWKGTVNEVGTFELKNGQIKLYYRSQDEKILFFAEIIFNTRSDFDDLYNVIMDGFDKKTDFPIKVDLGDSYLYLYYDPMLFGSPLVRFVHAYKESPYSAITSNTLSRKDINKLFGK